MTTKDIMKKSYWKVLTCLCFIMAAAVGNVWAVSENKLHRLVQKDGWYEIYSGTDLRDFAIVVNNGEDRAKARLCADIDMAGIMLADMGSEPRPYRGVFDGQGHVISNLNINRGMDRVGLFNCVGDGFTLRNVTLSKTCRINGLAFVGLVGAVVGDGSVTLSHVGNEGVVMAANQNAGGLVGCVFSGNMRCHIDNSYVSGLVKGGLESGAISGWLSVDPQLENCYSSATVSGTEGDKTFYRYSSAGRCKDCYETLGKGRQDLTTKVDASQLATGELTLRLNKQSTSQDVAWRQNLGEDRHPVLLPSHDVVLAINPNISFDASPLLHGIIINEIQAANVDQFVDPSFNYGGWVELYNPANTYVELDGVYVTDDPENPRKFLLPDFYGDIPAHGYCNIWFDHNAAEGEYGPEAYKQVDFKLDVEGGTIYFYDAKGELIASQSYPPAVARCSYARRSVDGDEWGMTSHPTPQASNAGVEFASERLAAPQVSKDGCVFDSPFSFTVDVPRGATLRYTTDCSTPTLTNGKTSTTRRFSVDAKTTIYRFCLFQDGKLPSEVVTRSFIYRDRTYNLPIISVTTDDANLFGDSLGVYVNGVNGVPGRGVGKSNINMDWERPVNFEYLLPDGTTAINQEASFHVAGGWNRHIYPQRSFKLKAAKQYELKNSFDYSFFEGKPYNKYKMLLVRNGGNDTGSGRCQDAIIQELFQSSGMYLDGQAWQPVQVLFNGGKFYAMMNLREASNKYFASSNYGYDTDEVDVMELVSGSGLTPLSGDMVAFEKLHELTTRVNEPGVYEQIKEMLDIDECANYMAAECYLGSWDWLTANNNTKVFRSRNDGRFHFVMYDVESAVDNSYVGMWNDLRNNRNIVLSFFNNLCRNEHFLRQFVDAYCLVDGSVFARERVDKMVERVKTMIAPALANEGLSPNESANRIYNIINTRGERMQCMHNYFNLGSHTNFAFSSNVPDASIMLNGVPVPTGRFEGRLYTPFELVATAPQGYRFIGWRLGGDVLKSTFFNAGSQWSYYDGGAPAGDWKQTDYAASNWKQGKTPIGYSTKRNDCVTVTQSYLSAYYFRKDVILDAKQMDDMLYLELDCTVDDGFVIYVNGVEAHRYLMPEGVVDHNTMATTYTSGDPDKVSVTLDKSLFHTGRNTLAVEVHNNILESSDIHWNASLQIVKSNSSNTSTSPKLVVNSNPDFTQVEAIFEKKAEIASTPILVNEVSAKNEIYVSDHFKKDDWFELYNQTDEDIDVAGMYLSDKASNWQKYCVPATEGVNTIVPAHGTLVVWADGREAINQLHVPFKLNNSDGSQVTISAADGSWSNTLQYREHDSSTTYGRYPDGGNASYCMTRPTIDLPNYLCTFDYDVFDVGEDMKSSTLLMALSKGWNWMSHNLSEAVPVGVFERNASLIRSQREENRTDPVTGWNGSLRYLMPALGYKLQAIVDHEVELQGDAYPVDERSQNLVTGWNWIGAPLAASTNLTLALANYKAGDGDEVVGQEGFAVFEEGEWHGSLQSFTPGAAYMFKANKSQSFLWNVLTRRTSRRKFVAPVADVPDGPWRPDMHAYPEVMTLVVRLDAADVLESTEGVIVGAFCGEECRGVAAIEGGVCFLTVYGEGGENISFRVLTNDMDEYDADQSLSFTSLALHGSMSEPYTLTINEATPVPSVALADKVVSVMYYTLDGKRLSAPSRQGITLVRTIYADGRVVTRKQL